MAVSGPVPAPRDPRAALETMRGWSRDAAAEWRIFLGREFGVFRGIGVSAAIVAALAGDGLTIPLLLELGANAALATAIGVLPTTFSAAQLLVPRLLRRADGNLRRVTLLILAVGETRGLIFGAITALAAAGWLPPGAAIAGIALVASSAGAATTIGGTNLLAWYGAILREDERRFVAPRVMGITLGLGAFLLLPVALAVQLGLHSIGISVYAAVFGMSGVAGIAELVVLRRLPNPGRVRVAEPGAPMAHPPGLGGFIRSIALAAFGAGFGPYLSVYSISVLGLTPAFALVLSSLGSASALIASTIVSGWLAHGSSSRLLRMSFLVRGGSMLFGLLAFPANPLAWLVLCVVAVAATAGWSAGTLAANERLLRLTQGVNLIGAQGRFVAATAAGITGGQLSNAAILALAPVGYPAFAVLFLVSGLTRFAAAVRAEVSASWTTTAATWNSEDFRPGPHQG